MMGQLSGKVVVVTGGAGRLGARFCEAIVANGGAVLIADLEMDRALAVATHLSEVHRGRVNAFAMDITKPTSVDAAIAAAREYFGRVDAVVNNAYPRNLNYGARLEDVTYADFCENVNMHLGGYFLVAQRFAAAFREQGGGAIINMSSVYGFLAPRFHVYDGTAMTMPVEYAAIKAGVLQLTRYFAKYFAGTGIRVNSISPGGILDHQPNAFLEQYRSFCGTKGMLDPSDVCGALVFLLSDASAYVNGHNLTVDDGFSL